MARFCCLFCDDVRQEIDGKVSYIGAYNGGLVFYEPSPIATPKLVIACLIQDVEKGAEYSLVVRQTGAEDRKKVVTIDEFETFANNVNVFFEFRPFVIPEPGKLEVLVKEKTEEKSIGLLNLDYQPKSESTT